MNDNTPTETQAYQFENRDEGNDKSCRKRSPAQMLNEIAGIIDLSSPRHDPMAAQRLPVAHQYSA